MLCAPDGWLRLGNDEIVANAAARSLFDSTHAPVILEACRCFAVAGATERKREGRGER